MWSKRECEPVWSFLTRPSPPSSYLELEGDDAGCLTACPQDVLVTGQVVRLGDLPGFFEEVRPRVQHLDIVLPLNTELGGGMLPQDTDVRGQALGKQILPTLLRFFQSFQNPLPRMFSLSLLVAVTKIICSCRERSNKKSFDISG